MERFFACLRRLAGCMALLVVGAAASLAADPGAVTSSDHPPWLPSCPPGYDDYRHVEPSPFFERDNILFLVDLAEVILWRSQDGGATWSQVYNFGRGGVQDFDVAPLEREAGLTLYLRYAYGTGYWPNFFLVRSTDGGQTWEERTPCEGLNCTWWPSFSPTNQPGVLFATRSFNPPLVEPPEGILRSLDDAGSWQMIWSETGALGVAPSPDYVRDQTVFAWLQWRSPSLGSYLIASHDGGETWEGRDPNLCDFPALQVALSPGFSAAQPGGEGAIDQTVFVVQGGYVFKSVDGGRQFWPVYPPGLPRCQATYPNSADELHFSPDYPDDQTVYMTTNAGMFYASYDAGERWYPLARADQINSFRVVRRPPAHSAPSLPREPTAPGLAGRWRLWRPTTGHQTYLPVVTVGVPPPYHLYLPLIAARGPQSRTLTIFLRTGVNLHSYYRSDDGGLSWQCLVVPPEKP